MRKNNRLMLEPKVKKANVASLREEMANLIEEMARMRAIVLAQGERLSSQLRVLKKVKGESETMEAISDKKTHFVLFWGQFFLVSSSILINI